MYVVNIAHSVQLAEVSLPTTSSIANRILGMNNLALKWAFGASITKNSCDLSCIMHEQKTVGALYCDPLYSVWYGKKKSRPVPFSPIKPVFSADMF